MLKRFVKNRVQGNTTNTSQPKEADETTPSSALGDTESSPPKRPPVKEKPSAKTADEINDLMLELRQVYMTHFHEIIEECDALASSHDTKGFAEIGHRLKGNGASFGFPGVSDIGDEMEKLGKAGDFENILQCVEKLRVILSQFQTAISENSSPPQI